MDSSSRKKVNKRGSSRKANEEMNGNFQSGNKAENPRRQKQTRDCYRSDFKDHHAGLEGVVPSYMPVHGQRLFTAVSDPAVCGYPVSLAAYPYDHLPMSMGYQVYHPAPHPQRVSYKDTVRSPRKPRHRNNLDKADQVKDTFQTVDEYTSLPPVNLQDIESDQQRRFSDPGLANNSASEEDSLSNDGSLDSWYEESQVAGQIETLVQENKRLSKELKETQVELQELKLEVASITQAQASYEPGFVSELVREVHEATKLREEAFLARMKSFSENLNHSLSSSSVESRKDCTKECKEAKERLAVVTTEKDELATRLSRLEQQMATILLHNCSKETREEELLETKKQNLQLKEELKSAMDAKHLAERNSTKYERLLSAVSKRLPNGLVLEEKLGASNSLDSESLSSSLGSGSLPTSLQPQVTLSGPVTDL